MSNNLTSSSYARDCACPKQTMRVLCVSPQAGKKTQSKVKVKSEREVTCGQVWRPILGICALHLTNPCAHTQSSEHTHTVNTHPEQWAAILLRRPGSSWGFGALLKGLTSVVVLRVEESAGYSLPPPTIPSGPETCFNEICALQFKSYSLCKGDIFNKQTAESITSLLLLSHL